MASEKQNKHNESTHSMRGGGGRSHERNQQKDRKQDKHE
jgi:hypothetical protein